MAVLLPYVTRRPLPDAPSEVLAAIETGLAQGTIGEGYVLVETPRGDAALFFHRGRTYSAGEVIDGEFASRTVVEFFHRLPDARSAAFHGTDLPLFLCTAVLFRKAPAASLPLEAASARELLEAVSAEGSDAVIAVRNLLFYTLVFCHEGRATTVYSADPSFPTSGGIEERLLSYASEAASTGDVRADLYTDIKLPPSSDAGLSLDTYRGPSASEAAEEAPPTIIIKMAGQVMLHFPITKPEVTVGRGQENDLPLDSRTVSRRHAVIRVRDEGLEIVDLGGENGLVFEGKREASVMLVPGREVSVGSYDLYFSEVSATPGAALPPTGAARVSLERTIAMRGRAKKSSIAYGGKEYRINVPVFLIGSSIHAHVRIDGFLVAPVHLEIQRIGGGSHRVRRIGRWRRLHVAGRPTKEAVLENGLEFSVGPHRFVYTVGDGTSDL